ncbi:MAG: metallophosphoesterase [Planctomycetota bacterium]
MATFVHLTDLHIGDPALGIASGAERLVPDPRPRTDTAERLGAGLARIAGMDPQPDFILVTGDLTNEGDVASYQTLRTLMADVAPPVLYGLGNHDSRGNFASVFLGEAGRRAPHDHDVLIGDVHVITLDSSEPGRVGGTLSPAQVDFLAEALARHPGAGKVLSIHHPPATGPVAPPAYEALDPDSTARLGEIVARGGLRAILCGHIHKSRVTLWHGVPVVVTTGFHTAIDVLSPTGFQVMSNDAAFAVCTLTEHEFAVSYVALPTDYEDLGRISEADIGRYEAALERS